ncbi:type II toxin-antitoxin system RelE/ParE family toxin [Candidatus Bathyarchaeota archaeon]|nr:type II toxin-antitoxin system RelE/ParE family toxin [Candidatus Bathyarchaeota archaeon]
MLIVETTVFTRRVVHLLPDESYRALQTELAQDPEKGTIIPGSGGLRKLRWEIPGRGKRGGSRIIYYWASAQQIILMLFLYGKNEQDDLSLDQLRMLRRLVESEYK